MGNMNTKFHLENTCMHAWKGLPFLRASRMETVWRSGDSQRGGGLRWCKDTPAASILSSSHGLAGAGDPVTLLCGGHVGHEVHHPVAVAKFIVIPGNELDKVVVEGNASPSIEGRRVSVAVEVAGDNLVLSVA